jgi:acetyltransferase
LSFKAYRDVPPADGTAIALTLVKLAQLVADLPEVRELDLNPLLADENGVIAVALAPAPAAGRGRRGHPRFSHPPLSEEWERNFALPGGLEALVRPVRPEDEDLFRTFFAAVTEEDLRLRFFAPVRDISQAFIARLIQLDYARAMAFVAIDKNSGAMLGAVRLHRLGADATDDRRAPGP